MIALLLALLWQQPGVSMQPSCYVVSMTDGLRCQFNTATVSTIYGKPRLVPVVLFISEAVPVELASTPECIEPLLFPEPEDAFVCSTNGHFIYLTKATDWLSK